MNPTRRRSVAFAPMWAFVKPTDWFTAFLRFLVPFTDTFRSKISSSFRFVKFHVFTIRHYFKIFYSIVSFVSIFMVDIFLSIKFTSEMFLHNVSMFFNIFAINHHRIVSATIDRVKMDWDTSCPISTTKTAKLARCFFPHFIAKTCKTFPTNRADQFNSFNSSVYSHTNARAKF